MRLVRNTVLTRLMDRFVLLTKSTLKRQISPYKFPPGKSEKVKLARRGEKGAWGRDP